MGVPWRHRLTAKDLDARTGICSECGPVRLKVGKTRAARCLNSYRQTKGEWKPAARRPPADQRCEVCGRRPVCWDHDHRDGRHRGWLCFACNTAIGHFQDDPDRLRRAADYLEVVRGRSPV